jgi:ATP-dependent protease ClpP protease subunit
VSDESGGEGDGNPQQAAGSEGAEQVLGQGLGDQDRGGQGGTSGGQDTQKGQAPDGVVKAFDEPERVDLPAQSPIFHAQHAARYDRQALIKRYEAMFSCRLIVMNDLIIPDSVMLIEDLIFDADPGIDLHLILNSPGGDGESALRIIRSLQARCRELTVIVPDQAKSAATLLTIGADHIIMGPTSDLGPVDPQLLVGDQARGQYVAAKDIVDAVDDAMRQVTAAPDTYPLHASLLADVNALVVQQARSALARTDDQLMEALRSNPNRSRESCEATKDKLVGPLITDPKSHGAVFGAEDASTAGLPVNNIDPRSDQWQLIWRLWAKYLVLPGGIYEGHLASQQVPAASGP